VERKRIAARFRIEKRGDSKRGQELRHKPVELVRAKCEPCASAAELISGFKEARKQARLVCDVLFIMLHKPPGELRKLRRIRTLPGRAERVIEHRLGAISHAPPDRVRTRRPEAFGDQSGIRRVDEIGRSIGNRPIEVENDCGTVNGLPPILSALAASATQQQPFPSQAAVPKLCDQIEPRFG